MATVIKKAVVSTPANAISSPAPANASAVPVVTLVSNATGAGVGSKLVSNVAAHSIMDNGIKSVISSLTILKE